MFNSLGRLSVRSLRSTMSSFFDTVSVAAEHTTQAARPNNASTPLRIWLAAIRSDVGVLALTALASVLLRTLVNGQYGFHRDELLTYTNARHLDWGYVPYPPITAFLARIELELFGSSLRGFRSLEPWPKA